MLMTRSEALVNIFIMTKSHVCLDFYLTVIYTDCKQMNAVKNLNIITKKEENMKRFAAFVLCLVMICSCGFAQCFADGSEAESATVIIPEAPLCLDYATNGQTLELLDSSGDYVKVKSANGVEGFADARWLTLFPVSGKAKVWTERVEIFSEMLEQDAAVEVVERGDEFTKVKVNGVEGEIETRFLRFDGDDEYQSWTCYTAPDTHVFDNPWLREAGDGVSDPVWVMKNTEFTVLADLGTCYYVKNDSLEGYIAKDFAKDSEVDYTLWGNPNLPDVIIEEDEWSHERQTEPTWLIQWEITIGKRFSDGTINPDWVDPSN